MKRTGPPQSELCRPVPLDKLRDAAMAHAGEATQVERATLAQRFGLRALRSLAWRLESKPWRKGMRVTGTVEAEVVQECGVTLDPVEGRIAETVDRGFLDLGPLYGAVAPNSEVMIEDDEELGDLVDPLTDPLDIGEIVAETLATAIDPYPRHPDAEAADYSAAPAGAEPIREAEVKPFAALEALRDRMKDDTGR